MGKQILEKLQTLESGMSNVSNWWFIKTSVEIPSGPVVRVRTHTHTHPRPHKRKKRKEEQSAVGRLAAKGKQK
jgi:hypothetical protein